MAYSSLYRDINSLADLIMRQIRRNCKRTFLLSFIVCRDGIVGFYILRACVRAECFCGYGGTLAKNIGVWYIRGRQRGIPLSPAAAVAFLVAVGFYSVSPRKE
jgi:hypothetical protein